MVERITDIREGLGKCRVEGRETVDYCTLHPKTLPLTGHSVTSKISNRACRHFHARI